MANEFPLIAKWMPGLKVHKTDGKTTYLVEASDLEKELAKGCELSGNPEDEAWSSRSRPYLEDTHEALLIGARPIRGETAEDLLRELVKDINLGFMIPFNDVRNSLSKARAFLEKAEGK